MTREIHRRVTPFELTAFHLRALALACMLCDHLWATVIPGNQWLTWVGRLAFPLFAFQLVEGYCHTRDLGRYKRRLLVFALLSEAPNDLVYGGTAFFPFHQNVLWTLLLGLGVLWLMDRVRAKWPPLPAWALTALIAVAAYFGAYLLMVDYYGPGILMILTFYFTRGRRWGPPVQLAAMAYINCVLLAGEYVTLFGGLAFPTQGFALLALVPIWLYRGRQGLGGRGWRRFSYWFYPLHLLALYGIWQLV